MQIPTIVLGTNGSMDSLSQEKIEENVSELLNIRAATLYEQQFWIHGSYGEIELEKFNVQEVNEILKTRGLPSLASKKSNGLDPRFVVACDLICDSLDKKSKAIKLKSVGLSTKQWNAFLRLAEYREYFKKKVDLTFKDADESAKLSLGKNIEAGDLQSIKFYYEFTGQHDPNKEITTNLNKLINLFLEVLVRYVEPSVLDQITSEFDTKILEIDLK